MRRAVVIGAGFGGLAAAVRLAAKGWSVTVCERNAGPGGRARVDRVDGYVFDLGPSVITGPSILRELWSCAGARLEDDVTLLRVDPSYRFVFDDGIHVDLSADTDLMRAEVGRLAPDDLEGWDRYRAHVERFWSRTVSRVMHTPMQSPLDLLPFAPGMIADRGFLPMNELVRRYLKNRHLVRALRFHPTFVGASPWGPGSAIYSSIQGLEWEEGVWFPKGGTNALVSAMEALAKRKGATFRYGAEARAIDTERGRATGVTLASGERLDADVVISNADAAFTYERLLAGSRSAGLARWLIERAHYATGLFVWYFGTKHRFPDVQHHTVLPGRDLPGAWHPLGPDTFDPFIYLHRPTATDPSLAPDGCDAFYALCAVPNLQGVKEWDWEAPQQRAKLLRALSASVLPGLEDAITVERTMFPPGFARTLDTVNGAGFGLAPTLMQSACFRPHARSGAVRGLYLVGEGTHPGPGVPAVLSSARIVDELLSAGGGK